MIKIIFGVIFAGVLYYVVNPLLGRRVSWVDAEEPDDERMRELELAKKINLKALKDIEFELASGKINDEDFLELRDHYAHKVSRIMGLIEDLAGEEEGAIEAHHGGRGKKDPEGDEGSDESENELDEDEYDEEDDDEDDDEDGNEDDDDEYDDDEYDDDEDEEEGDDDEDEILQGSDNDYEDDEWDEDEDDEYERRNVKGPTLTVLVLALAVGVGVALFQMGKKSAAPAPAAPITSLPAPSNYQAGASQPLPSNEQANTSLPAPSNEQAGLEHLVKYVQENPWNVTSHLILGEYYLDAGDTNVALAHFISAEGIKPDSGRVLSNLGQTYRKLGNTDQAIDKFKAATAAEPESLEHLYQLGLVYGYDKGDLTQALALFEEILSRQPDENLRVTVGEELRKLGLSDG